MSLQDPITVGKARVEVGLENLGNTCFVNSSLQCLFHIRPLVDFFVQEDIAKYTNMLSPMKGQLALSFSNLVRDLVHATSPAISPINFIRSMAVCAPHLLDFQQQDSQEFLRFLLDGMSEDLCRRNKYNANLTPNKVTKPSVLSVDDSTAEQPSEEDVTHIPISDIDSDGEKMKTILSTSVKRPTSTGSRKMNSVEKLRTTTIVSRDIDDTHTENFEGLRSSSAQSRDSRHFTIESDILPEENAEESIASTVQPSVPTTPKSSVIARGLKSLKARFSSPRDNFNSDSSAQVQSNDGSNHSIRNSRIKKDLVLADNQSSQIVPSLNLGTEADTQLGDENQPPETSNDNNFNSKQINLELLAHKSWGSYLKYNDSIITDLFAGQLQSTIECTVCHHKSWCFDPFLDLSVPIPKGREKKKHVTMRGFISEAPRCSLEECIELFTGGEVLDGENMVTCDECKAKRKSIKTMSIFRYPRVLVVHIKRFRYSNIALEKQLTDVNFPMTGLDLRPYLSERIPSVNKYPNDPEMDSNQLNSPVENVDTSPPNFEDFPMNTSPPIYDLVGVSNHMGGLSGGHYVAHANTQSYASGSGSRWMCFNDEKVFDVGDGNISGPSAYVLFYRLRNDLVSSDGV